MTLEQRVAVLEEIFLKLKDYYMSTYSGEEIDALLASAGVPIGITKEYDSVSAMNSDFSGTDVTRGQFVLILPSDTSSEDYGKVYIKSTSNWVYVFTLTALTAIKGPQGPAGANGETGATGQPGKNFAVLGYYETLSALNAAVPSPEAGDTYGIGTEPPYAYYMYDPTISNWRYVGNLQGPAGSQGEKGDKGDKGDTGATGPQGPEGPVGGASNFVRYDASQALTDAQKTQARTNIGAAKSTFLGNISRNKIYKIGYFFTGTGSSNRGAVTLRVCDASSYGHENYMLAFLGSDGCAAEYHGIFDPDLISKISLYSGPSTTGATKKYSIFATTPNYADWADVYIDNEHSFTRDFVDVTDTFSALVDGLDKVWESEYEYANPPMQLGVEYRTTERYLGKPVYAQLVNMGAAPSPGTSKIINISNAIYISLEGTLDYGSYRQVLPFFMADGTLESRITNSGDAIVAQFRGTTDYSSQNLHVLAKYIKSTD